MITTEQVQALQANVDLWATRHAGWVEPTIRKAADDIVDALDAMLADIYQLRAKTKAEAQWHDDLTLIRLSPALHRAQTTPMPDRSGWDQQ
ncbi:MAG TPA: hypothetical protein VFB74_30615 [Kribbellaceae bacterium]|nr:hypothetical protein [Kribbellaceae bacterium]